MNILLVVPDNGSYISTFPLGIGYIAAVLRNEGHRVEIFSKDVYHYSADDLTKYLDAHDFDVVGSGTCGGYRQYREMKSIAAAVSHARKKPVFITGGAFGHSRATILFESVALRLRRPGRGRGNHEGTLPSLGGGASAG